MDAFNSLLSSCDLTSIHAIFKAGAIQNYNAWAIKFKLYDCVTWCTVQVSDAASV